ncbi:hypothetical protein [Novosphingobium guangzhouense]|uniref:Uncharacterized protein n=1 Tax=Novosphingobium guangzhouense TaxID=1850347 RepID=A0A2K2FTF5_9SPHN|nr:hypothetical protein [Novosphingobium guangzhouense]PNU02075.1 hypothetical protein A8V01_27020 [Novosphingobium guangzhouense]
MPADAPSSAPYGIDPLHCEVPRLARWRTPLATAVFVVVLGSALLGWLGGGPPDVTEYRTPLATATLEYEPVLRSGNWFETVLNITPRRDVADLVVTVDQPLWRGMSIDTLTPDAESVEALDGRYTHHFGKMRAGETFRMKFDGQIQPRALRTLSGFITVEDGTRPLVSMPVGVTVLP